MSLLCSDPLVDPHGTRCKSQSSSDASEDPLQVQVPPPGMFSPPPHSCMILPMTSFKPFLSCQFLIEVLSYHSIQNCKSSQIIGPPNFPSLCKLFFFCMNLHLLIDYLNSSASLPRDVSSDKDFVNCSLLSSQCPKQGLAHRRCSTNSC